MEILKVSSKSDPRGVSGALLSLIKNTRKLEIHAIGAGAINQAIKSIAISRGALMPGGLDLKCKPAFLETNINSVLKTGMRLIVELEQVV
jgi:stage V sporulation protein S